MKKVMIYAYSNLNLGDDLFIKLLCERYTNTQFLLYAPKGYKKLFEDLQNISIFPSDTLLVKVGNFIFRVLKVNRPFLRTKIAKKCDAAVNIGGSIFMQVNNWKNQFENKEGMQIKNKPFYLLGANFGPFIDSEYFLAYKNLFSKYTDICFRDSYSYELFKDLPNVRLADDIVFQLKEDLKIKEEKNNVVISVIRPSVRKQLENYDEIYYKKIKDTIIYLNEKGYYVTLMSFCEKEGDKEAVEEILELLPDRNKIKVKKHYYKYNIKEALQTIANSKFVVATRFHAMILGWVFNKPVFPIVYSQKMTNVMKDVGFDGLYTDFNQLENLDVADVYKGMQLNLIDVSKQAKKSEQHFMQLDKYLLE
ncbi:hypothetical protein GI584_20400 [Gracilibacillus salitolerans]|uniref:Polysaccharide pyruvyl transferase domain-containing protein n=1 Tax=Gracilibacillus salitolerans TaxID=2663022 RepID=A0A5Q2TN84_9BACI|nr:polysaccharide pyruvyl transferase family protein [Gracilibacillus salitolerans]QGH36256.1 hypothetical protein GI584_20400 [Gracilibacillus salitolerans]